MAFEKIELEFGGNLFLPLCDAIQFDQVVKGRLGANLVKLDKDGHVPLVRTTTRYACPAQRFRDIHLHVLDRIGGNFNNCLIEIYDSSYRSMGYHSDQALDLANDSYIAIFSCYENPLTDEIRTLLVKSKQDQSNVFKIPLTHNSVIMFSTSTNAAHLHKIVLEKTGEHSTRWLGMTCRLSKTFIAFRGATPFFAHLEYPLTLATAEQAAEFYKLRKQENTESVFSYPQILHTISKGDMLPVA